ncbi:MAG: aminotransferase class IV [Candidatus Poribacteria bacterium]|nr:aminotransferase class IV [Candidatus Poribacteria bacterium]
MVQERVVFFNGGIIPEREAKVPFRDRGFMFGDAVFDATRTFGGEIFKLKEHLDRFYDSLKYMRIDPGMTLDRMAELTCEVVHANFPLLGENDDTWASQRVSRGSLAPDGAFTPTVIIETMPIPFAARAKFFRDGLSVITPATRRTPPECMSPRAKLHNYINLFLGEQEVKAQNPDAIPILLDINGNICEGAGANILIVKDGVVITPKDQYILAGISRRTTMELAADLGIEVREEDIDLFDAYTADEAFITSTSYCICPVSSANGITIGDGSVPGPVTHRLQTAYSELVGIDIVGQYLSRLD